MVRPFHTVLYYTQDYIILHVAISDWFSFVYFDQFMVPGHPEKSDPTQTVTES